MVCSLLYNLLQKPCWLVPSSPSIHLSLHASPASLPSHPVLQPCAPHSLPDTAMSAGVQCDPTHWDHTHSGPRTPNWLPATCTWSEGTLLSPRTDTYLLAPCYQPRCHRAFSTKHGIAAAPFKNSLIFCIHSPFNCR